MKRALLLILLASACGPHDAEVVTFGDGGRPSRREPCATDADCRDFELCEKTECEAPSGFCAPLMCMPSGGPVCGCDGVTYGSSCERRRARVASFVPGACP